MNKLKKIIFLPENINPNSAPFNRFYTLYKLVNKIGYLTTIIFVQPQREDKIRKNVLVSDDTLTYNSITYNNTQVFPVKTNFLKKVFLKLQVYKNALKLITKESKKYQLILYLNSNDLRDYIFFYLIVKILNLKLVKEFNEYPMLVRNPKIVRTIYYNYLIRPWSYRFFDGMIIMTQSLVDYYTKHKGKNTKIAKIPMTVDPERFENCHPDGSKYLGYVGGLNCKKDGLDILIKAFALISPYFLDYNLKIAGFSYFEGEIEYLENLVKNLNISDRVFFVGALSREEIPEFIISSALLILPRPESKQAEGGFPTKLGEYLISGNPVIVTKVGEILEYLTDGKDVYAAEPGNVEDLSEKMREVLQDYEKAKNIGESGKKTALKNFDYNIHADTLINFLEAI